MNTRTLKVRMLVTLFLCLPALAMAQNEDQMRHMMEQAQKAQVCMEKIDRDKLEAMARKAEQVESNIESLCAAGKRDEAQRQGLKFGLEMSQSVVAKDMRKCSELMAGALAGMGSSFMPGMDFPNMDDMKDEHICDVY